LQQIQPNPAKPDSNFIIQQQLAWNLIPAYTGRHGLHNPASVILAGMAELLVICRSWLDRTHDIDTPKCTNPAHIQYNPANYAIPA